MSKKIFQASQFVALGTYYTAQDKADWANAIVKFLENGCPRLLFTKKLYTRLSNAYGHIAHTSIDGFYHVWFADDAKRLRFIEHTIYYKVYGSPEFTFSDAEKAIQNWLAASGLREDYRCAVEAQQRYDAVVAGTNAILKVIPNPSPTQVKEAVQTARLNIERASNCIMSNDSITAIEKTMLRAYCETEIVFKVAAISKNANGFGHHGHKFVAQDGEAWQATCYRGPGGIFLHEGQTVRVPLLRGLPNFTKLGFEVPESIGTAPKEVVQHFWNEVPV